MHNKRCITCLNHWTWNQNCGCRIHYIHNHDLICKENTEKVICIRYQRTTNFKGEEKK